MGINSFGFGGTNAHVVLEGCAEADQTQEQTSFAKQDTCLPLLLSAKSKESVLKLAVSWKDFLTQELDGFNDEKARLARFNQLAAAVLQQRDLLTHRVLVQGKSVDGVIRALEAASEEKSAEPSDAILVHDRDTVAADKAKTAFVFSGNGSQWVGMGTVLYRDNTVFRTAVDEADVYFEPLAGFKLSSVLTTPTDDKSVWSLDRTEIAQPLLFACQLGLLACLRSIGIDAQAYCGHSVGEVAAAYAAGRLTLANAVKIIYQRSRLQGKTRGAGVMAAVHLKEGLDDLLKIHGEIAVAGINAPESLTVSGPQTAMSAFFTCRPKPKAMLPNSWRWTMPSTVRHGNYHADILHDLATLFPNRQEDLNSCFYSTVSGDALADDTPLDASYWWKNVRNAVMFESAVRAMLRDGVRRFVEVGPHAILVGYLRNTARAQSIDVQICALERRGDESADHLMSQMFKAVAGGVPMHPAWPVVPRERNLPHYPWNRTLAWNKPTSETAALFAPQQVPTLLGYPVAKGRNTWVNRVDTVRLDWLAGHRIDDTVLFPAAGFLEAAVSAGQLALKDVLSEAQAKGKKEVAELVNFSILRGLPLAGKESHTMRTRVTDDGVLTIESHREGANEPFGLLVRSRVRAADTTGLDAYKLNLTITHNDSAKVNAEAFYQHLQSAGLNYTDAFLSVAELWFDKTKQHSGADCSVLARLSCPSPLYANAALGIEAKLSTVPPLVDAAMQSVFAAVGRLLSDKPENAQLTHAYLPVFFGRVLMLARQDPGMVEGRTNVFPR